MRATTEGAVINEGFLVAGLIAIVTFCVHTFVGEIYVVRPLLAVERLSRASRWLNFYCWHVTTIVIAAMAGVFLFAAWRLDVFVTAALFTGLAAAFALLCAGVAIRGGVPPFRFPALTLFALIALAGSWGVYTA